MAFSCKYVNVMNGAMFQSIADKTISDTARIMRENNDRQDPTCQFLIPVRADFFSKIPTVFLPIRKDWDRG